MFAYIALILITVLLLGLCKYWSVPFIHDIWVVNLKRRPDRLAAFQAHAKEIPFHVWEATDGKQITRSFAIKNGIDCVILTSNCYDGKDEITQYNGVVGCWLSHKLLLTHLLRLAVSDNAGHLICEDDVVLNEKVHAAWEKIKYEIPHDYDMVYLGYGGVIKASPISNNVNKMKHCTGTYGYIVRHGSLKKILKRLEHFSSAIDIQYSHMFSELNVYAPKVPIIIPDDEIATKTDIQSLT